MTEVMESSAEVHHGGGGAMGGGNPALRTSSEVFSALEATLQDTDSFFASDFPDETFDAMTDQGLIDQLAMQPPSYMFRPMDTLQEEAEEGEHAAHGHQQHDERAGHHEASGSPEDDHEASDEADHIMLGEGDDADDPALLWVTSSGGGQVQGAGGARGFAGQAAQGAAMQHGAAGPGEGDGTRGSGESSPCTSSVEVVTNMSPEVASQLGAKAADANAVRKAALAKGMGAPGGGAGPSTAAAAQGSRSGGSGGGSLQADTKRRAAPVKQEPQAYGSEELGAHIYAEEEKVVMSVRQQQYLARLQQQHQQQQAMLIRQQQEEIQMHLAAQQQQMKGAPTGMGNGVASSTGTSAGPAGLPASRPSKGSGKGATSDGGAGANGSVTAGIARPASRSAVGTAAAGAMGLGAGMGPRGPMGFQFGSLPALPGALPTFQQGGGLLPGLPPVPALSMQRSPSLGNIPAAAGMGAMGSTSAMQVDDSEEVGDNVSMPVMSTSSGASGGTLISPKGKPPRQSMTAATVAAVHRKGAMLRSQSSHALGQLAAHPHALLSGTSAAPSSPATAGPSFRSQPSGMVGVKQEPSTMSGLPVRAKFEYPGGAATGMPAVPGGVVKGEPVGHSGGMMAVGPFPGSMNKFDLLPRPGARPFVDPSGAVMMMPPMPMMAPAVFGGTHISGMRKVFSTGDIQSLGAMQNPSGVGRLSPFEEHQLHLMSGASPFKVGRYSAEERRQRITRYRQKRNERNFKKTIKYACRKTLADSRPRIRGRFARNDELDGENNDEDDVEGDSDEDGGEANEDDLLMEGDPFSFLDANAAGDLSFLLPSLQNGPNSHVQG